MFPGHIELTACLLIVSLITFTFANAHFVSRESEGYVLLLFGVLGMSASVILHAYIFFTIVIVWAAWDLRHVIYKRIQAARAYAHIHHFPRISVTSLFHH